MREIHVYDKAIIRQSDENASPDSKPAAEEGPTLVCFFNSNSL